MIFPAYLEAGIIKALKLAHPYEEVAYDIINLSNFQDKVGSGLIGDTEGEMEEMAFLVHLKEKFRLQVLRHTALTGTKVNRVALCGGAGSFLIQKALAAGADVFVTSDVKYHEFFDANGRMVIADIGHCSRPLRIARVGELCSCRLIRGERFRHGLAYLVRHIHQARFCPRGPRLKLCLIAYRFDLDKKRTFADCNDQFVTQAFCKFVFVLLRAIFGESQITQRECIERRKIAREKFDLFRNGKLEQPDQSFAHGCARLRFGIDHFYCNRIAFVNQRWKSDHGVSQTRELNLLRQFFHVP